MKLLSPCCQNQQDYNPRKKWDGHSRRTTLCKKCKKVFDIDNDTLIEEESVKNIEESIPPQDTTQDPLRFIDDPNELLLSTAIRELNKPNPDPRWANILINCKKEKITTKTEVIEEFRQQPTQLIVNLLNKSLQKEP